jgi:hypothetical protein
MKLIQVIIYLNFLVTLSSITVKPKLCIDCKFFTKDFFNSNEFGRCKIYPKEVDHKYFLVDGINKNSDDYYFCCTARDYEDMCGSEGKYYEKRNNNIFKIAK